MLRALRDHWPEYLIEAGALGAFMVSAGVVATLFGAPGSALGRLVPDPTAQRLFSGVLMGLTAVAIVYSPWGQRSGAHMNPAMTLAFLRLEKIAPWDALFYMVAQFTGGVTGVLLVYASLGQPFARPPVAWAATVPGPAGAGPALVAELAISFLLMTVVLWVSNSERLRRATGLFAGSLVALFIFFEGPFSGMSMNPARTVASAAPGGIWIGVWLYFLAPTAGMMLAAELFRARRGLHAVRCAKLDHPLGPRCIFRCGYCGHQAEAAGTAPHPAGRAGPHSEVWRNPRRPVRIPPA